MLPPREGACHYAASAADSVTVLTSFARGVDPKVKSVTGARASAAGGAVAAALVMTLLWGRHTCERSARIMADRPTDRPSFLPSNPPSSSRHRSRYGTRSFGRDGISMVISLPPSFIRANRANLFVPSTPLRYRDLSCPRSLLRNIASVREFKWRRKKIYSVRNYRSLLSRMQNGVSLLLSPCLTPPLLISSSSSFLRPVEFYLAHFQLPLIARATTRDGRCPRRNM